MIQARARMVLAAALWCLGPVLSPFPASADTAFRAQVTQTLAFVEQQLLETITEVNDPTQFPRSTHPVSGQWTTRTASDWTSGFSPGQLWLIYEHTGNEALRAAAEQWMANLTSQASRTDTHDLGFMILNSFGHAERITGDQAYRDTVLTATASLDTRFNPNVGATRSWDFGPWQFPVIVDNMMNLELLFWGAANGSDPVQGAVWSSHAISHADLTAASHVRPDGSSYHVVDFDPATGAILSRETHQGYGDETTWARGQAWGL